MTQNIDDDAGFFHNCSQLPRSQRGPGGAPEWPALRALLPPLAGAAVLDLGCGFGWFCRFAAGEGAGGCFVFAVEHPIMTAPRHQTWSEDASGLPVWPLGAYLDEGRRVTDWLAEGVVKQHRALASYLNLLVGLGLRLRHVAEWRPTPERIAVDPDRVRERERPAFLPIAAGRA